MKSNYLFFVLAFFLFSCNVDIGDGGYDSSGTYTSKSGEIAGGDKYKKLPENEFIEVSEAPVSTFSVDADGASYANVRRFLNDNQIPPAGAVRTEELLNYFNLEYPHTDRSHPIGLSGEVSSCPWAGDHRLIRIGIKGKNIPRSELPASNFVFLIDVSGSMSSDDKLELLKRGFKSSLEKMKPTDRIAIVTYAGASEVVLESTPVSEADKIHAAIDRLNANGGTYGAKGILTAYEIAEKNLIEGGNNRIILGTDGDYNIGPVHTDSLVSIMEKEREKGIFITVLGVGRGNYNDVALEQIADNGNGTFEYIDNEEQLRKVFLYDYSKFFTVAKDVKIQVKFNPDIVKSYRLIGYENRLLKEEDFKDDKKDAGEIGADQNITALYEIVLASSEPEPTRSIPTFTIDFRYKLPDEDVSNPMSLDIFESGHTFEKSSDYQKFCGGVASFAMQLYDSKYKGDATYDDVLSWVSGLSLNDPHGFKEEFKTLVKKAKSIKK